MISRLNKRSDAITRKVSVNDSELQPIVNKESEAFISKFKKSFYQVNSPERYKIAIECYGGQKDCYDIVIFARNGGIKSLFNKVGEKVDSHVANLSLSLKKHKTTSYLSQRQHGDLNSDWQRIYSVENLNYEKMVLLNQELIKQSNACHRPTARQVFSYGLFGAFSVLLFLHAKPDDLAQQWHLNADESTVNGVGATAVFIASDLLYFFVDKGINWIKAYRASSLRTPMATFSPNSYEMKEEQMNNHQYDNDDDYTKQSFQLL